MIALRPYQVEARDAVLADWQQHKAVLGVATMGMGKTEIFLSVLREVIAADPDARALILVHRIELAEQPRDRAATNWPELPPIGIVQADLNDCAGPITAAMVQTCAQPGRVQNILRYGAITHLIVDETHHVTAKTYLDIIKTLQDANPDLRILGVTATPMRTDGDGLRKVFSKVSFRYNIKDAIRFKALCPFTALAVELPPVTVRSTSTEDGWNQEEMGNALDYDNVREIVFTTWKEQASDRPTIFFTSGVAQAHHLAEYFSERGVPAAAVDGTTPKDERRRILAQYHAGTVRCLMNCAVYTEGFDAPHTACVGMVRPTKSDLVYLQAVGRGLRIGPPPKTDCLILDFCPVGLHDMRQAGDLLGKPKAVRKAEEAAKKAGLVVGAFAVDDEGKGIDGDVSEVKLRVLDMLARHNLQWTVNKALATATVSAEMTLAMVMPQPARVAKADEVRRAGTWTPAMQEMYRKLQGYSLYVSLQRQGQAPEIRTVGVYDSPDAARAAADEFAEDHVDAIGRKAGQWRKLDATAGQINFAKRLGVWHEGMKRGACAQAITQRLIEKELARARLIE